MKNLKTILIILLTSLINFHIFGQTFTIGELEKFNKMDMSSFKNEIKKLNYSFYDKTESPYFVLVEYDSPDYQYKIGKFEYVTDKTGDRIEFQFKGKENYSKYEKLIQSLGYKKTETGKIPGGEAYVDYFKNKAQIRLVSPREELENEFFTILVFK
ncbi:hypothetical protein SAMN05421841_3640 [Chryseobacterium wanjuense]|jgi:hypothetical protein|uniref:Omptin family protein n=1 Tax=Chryseobacterium wanjuense TaxID=356305 RepID=A0A1I0S0Z7_9FLAO|nr:hypothetical protein [Chryseobacterium wanjuense]SEW47835.1 hypothetical protein SAMN05421841_3640 [Chryseobacterium wanjuense]